MSAERLTVWLEPFDADLAARVGVLCRRHADAMVVPNRWSLDDRRPPAEAVEAAPPPAPRLATETATQSTITADSSAAAQLFSSPTSAAPDKAEKPDKPAKQRKRRGKASDDTGQLELLAMPDELAESDAQPEPEAAEPQPQPQPQSEPEPEPAVAPWKPVFDQGSDLEGLLDVRSPLLSRAFRGRSPKP